MARHSVGIHMINPGEGKLMIIAIATLAGCLAIPISLFVMMMIEEEREKNND